MASSLGKLDITSQWSPPDNRSTVSSLSKLDIASQWSPPDNNVSTSLCNLEITPTDAHPNRDRIPATSALCSLDITIDDSYKRHCASTSSSLGKLDISVSQTPGPRNPELSIQAESRRASGYICLEVVRIPFGRESKVQGGFGTLKSGDIVGTISYPQMGYRAVVSLAGRPNLNEYSEEVDLANFAMILDNFLCTPTSIECMSGLRLNEESAVAKVAYKYFKRELVDHVSICVDSTKETVYYHRDLPIYHRDLFNRYAIESWGDVPSTNPTSIDPLVYKAFPFIEANYSILPTISRKVRDAIAAHPGIILPIRIMFNNVQRWMDYLLTQKIHCFYELKIINAVNTANITVEWCSKNFELLAATGLTEWARDNGFVFTSAASAACGVSGNKPCICVLAGGEFAKVKEFTDDYWGKNKGELALPATLATPASVPAGEGTVTPGDQTVTPGQPIAPIEFTLPGTWTLVNCVVTATNYFVLAVNNKHHTIFVYELGTATTVQLVDTIVLDLPFEPIEKNQMVAHRSKLWYIQDAALYLYENGFLIKQHVGFAPNKYSVLSASDIGVYCYNKSELWCSNNWSSLKVDNQIMAMATIDGTLYFKTLNKYTYRVTGGKIVDVEEAVEFPAPKYVITQTKNKCTVGWC